MKRAESVDELTNALYDHKNRAPVVFEGLIELQRIAPDDINLEKNFITHGLHIEEPYFVASLDYAGEIVARRESQGIYSFRSTDGAFFYCAEIEESWSKVREAVREDIRSITAELRRQTSESGKPGIVTITLGLPEENQRHPFFNGKDYDYIPTPESLIVHQHLTPDQIQVFYTLETLLDGHRAVPRYVAEHMADFFEEAHEKITKCKRCHDLYIEYAWQFVGPHDSH